MKALGLKCTACERTPRFGVLFSQMSRDGGATWTMLQLCEWCELEIICRHFVDQ